VIRISISRESADGVGRSVVGALFFFLNHTIVGLRPHRENKRDAEIFVEVMNDEM